MTVSQEVMSSGHQGSGKSVEGHQHVWAPARSCTIWTLCEEVVAAACKERLQGYMHAVWDEGVLGPFWRPAQKPLAHGEEPLLLQLGSRPSCKPSDWETPGMHESEPHEEQVNALRRHIFAITSNSLILLTITA